MRCLCLLTALLLLLSPSGCMESDAIRYAREQVEVGNAAFAEGQHEEALMAYRRAMARAPDYIPARVALARSLVAVGE